MAESWNKVACGSPLNKVACGFFMDAVKRRFSFALQRTRIANNPKAAELKLLQDLQRGLFKPPALSVTSWRRKR